ncbi:transcription termination factor NusA [bacterium]|nr:transcription termination factor NusA [bacterium]
MSEVIKQFKQISQARNLDYEEVVNVFKDAVKLAFMKKGRRSSKDELYPIYMSRIEINVNEKRNDITVTFHKAVVEEVKNDWIEVSFDSEEVPEKKRQLGEMIKATTKLRKLPRNIANRIKRIFINSLNYKEKEILFKEFEADKIGDIIIGTVMGRARENGRVIGYKINIDKLTGILPREESVPRERYTFGKNYKFYVKEIREDEGEKRIILSRMDERFIIELMKREIPEIKDGYVTIKKIVRDPGIRVKIAVHSDKVKLDPVGACLGPGAKRIEGIRKVLGEKIDVVQFSTNVKEYIKNSLKPANIQKIALNRREKKALIVVPDNKEDLSHALGKNKSNKNLTGQLLGWSIEIITDVEYMEKLNEEKNAILNTQAVLSGLRSIPQEVVLEVANAFVTLEEIAKLSIDDFIENIENIDESMAKKIIKRAEKYAKK